MIIKLKNQNDCKIYYAKPVVDTSNYQESLKKYKHYLDELNSINTIAENKRKQREDYINSLSPEEKSKVEKVDVCYSPSCQLLLYTLCENLKFKPKYDRFCKTKEKYVHFYNNKEELLRDSLIFILNLSHKIVEIRTKYFICIKPNVEYLIFFVQGNKLFYNKKEEYNKLLIPNQSNYNIIMESCEFSKEALLKILESN